MGVTTGMVGLWDYSVPSGDPAKVQALLDLIPNPGTSSSSGAVAGGTNGVGNSFLDEMSPADTAQLRVELANLKAAVS